MTTHLVAFSDDRMKRAKDLCIESAIRNGVPRDNVDPWSDGDLCDLWHEGFLSESDVALLSKQPDDFRRALGWWSWKPAIISRNLTSRWCKDGDTLIYADAGIEFIAPVQHVIDRMDQDVWLFGNNWEHAHWCKRDVVDAICPLDYVMAHWPERYQKAGYALALGERPNTIAWDNFGKQCQASVIFFRVSDYSKQFVAEWLKWCLYEGGRLIDDSPSRTPNHPEFREHRHDQAILTTLAYREGIKLHAWPAVYNRFLGQEFVYSRKGYPSSDDYPSLYHHHRLRDSEFEALRIKG